jgi:PAS domain S-box-containing protein
LPLRDGAATFGALTIYAEEPDAFDAEETGLLEDLANELAFGILMQRLRVRNKQAEEALQRSEEKFRLVVEHIPMRIFIKDINSVYVSCNELCAQDWGLAPSAIAGMTDFDFHPHELAEQYRADDKLVMRSGQPAEMERRYVIGGKELFAHTIKVPFRDKDGRTVGVLGILWDITERRLAEERLRLSEHDLAEAQSIAHLGSWSLDLASNELTWSAENYRIFEIDPGKFGASYEAFLDAIHPDDREFVNQAYTGSLKDKKPYDIVHRLLMKDGRVKYVNERCETFYNDAGEPVRSLGTTHDITQLKQVEQNLLAVQNELTSTLNAIPDLLFELGLDGRYYSYRSPRTDLLSVPPEQLVGSLISDVLPPEASAVCLAALQEANETGYSSGQQFQLRLGEADKWFELSIARKTSEKTDDPRFIVISRDITERKRGELNLLTLYTAIDQSPISVVITDADARIQYINPHFTTISGYAAAEVIGKNPRMFKSEQTPDEVYADMWSKISCGQIWHGELLNRSKSGQLYSEETHIAPVKDASGRINQYVCLKIDNSERIQAEEKLAESYLELQRLSSHLEHLREDERAKIARDLHDEMGALLVALKMRASWLASKLPAEMPLLTEEAKHISALVAEAISSMHQIVTELRPNLQEGFGFAATFEDYVKKFQQRTGIECRFALPEEEMKLDTNRAVTLFRILQESLNNVEKYSQAKRVKILLTARDNSLSLVVEDNGVGFDPAMRKKGSFGLIGIRERTLMMGGKAKISSTPGKGTKVSITLPQI